MKGIVFYIVPILLSLAIGFYIYLRLRTLMPQAGCWQGIAARIAYVVLFFSFFIGFGLQHKAGLYMLSAPFTYVGSWVLAAIFYFLIAFVLVDIVRLVGMAFHSELLSFKFLADDSKARLVSISVCIIVALTLICGYFVARFPVRTEVKYTTDKNLQKSIKFVMVSDIHLGMIHCDKFLTVLKDRINLENPDFVVIAGDFFDGDPAPVLNSNAGQILREITSGCGIYAVTGNHEYIGNADVAAEFFRSNGVKILRDSVAELPFGVSIIGRDDRMKNHHTKTGRASIDSLVSQTKTDNFQIVLDHQPPRSLDEYVNSKVDLVLSGHTHAGAQLWPLFLITRKIYVNDYGCVKEGSTNFYTSSGYGTWGPPIRTASRPEMVVIEVEKK